MTDTLDSTIDQASIATAVEDERRPRWVPWAVALAVIAALTWIVLSTGSQQTELANFRVQGGGPDAEVYAENGAELSRVQDGLVVAVSMPTPAPGSYEYPARDVLSPGAAPHPVVEPGSGDQPEVFTLWLFAFNYPDQCTDGVCDSDDLALDADARGAVFQVDGRIAGPDMLEFDGRVRLGQVGDNGANLENPIGAEVHLAIAPHGRSLTDSDLWRQLNGPVGSIQHWWAATFLPPE